MSPSEIVVEGTLKADGTLELHDRPNLPPGPVRVTLRSEVLPGAAGETWWECLQRIRREAEASGAGFMNDEEVEEHIRWLREEDRIDEQLRLTEPSR